VDIAAGRLIESNDPSRHFRGDGFFAALAERIPFIVMAGDPMGRPFYFNRRWHSYTGLTPQETLLDNGHRAAVHPDDLRSVVEGFRTAIGARAEYNASVRYRRLDGVYRWHRLSCVPHYLEDGQFVGWIGTAVDVEDERSRDRALETLSQVLPVLLWTATPCGQVDYYSDRWAGMLDDAVHPSERDEVRAAFERSLESGEPYNIVARIRAGDDQYRWHRSHAIAHRGDDGEIVRWYGVTIDIHDSLSTDASAERDVSARIIRNLAQRTLTLLCTASSDGQVTFANEQWTEATGVAQSDLLGLGLRSVIYPDDLEPLQSQWLQLAHASAPFTIQFRLKRTDGVYRWVEMRFTPEIDAGGTTLQWIGIGIDIDEQRRATAALEYLVEAGASVARSGNLEDVLSSLATASLESLADVCIVDLFGEREPTRIVVGSSRVTTKDVQQLRLNGTPRPGERHPISAALYEGRSVALHLTELPVGAFDVSEERRWWWIDRVPLSLLSVPIARGAVTYGALTIVRVNAVQAFHPADLRVLEDISRRAALLIQNVRLNDTLRRESLDRLEQFRRIADLSPLLQCTIDPDGRVDWFNQQWYDYTGKHADDALGLGWLCAVHASDRTAVLESWERCLATGEPLETHARMLRHDGLYRWFLIRAACERSSDEVILKWYMTKTDVHESRLASRTLQTFSRLGEALSGTLDLQETLDSVMQIVIPDYAKYGHISLLDEAGDLRISAVYAADPDHHLELMRSIGQPFVQNEDTSSFVALPLIASNELQGMMTFYADRSDQRFDDDLPFFQELARRVIPAIANAKMYERERRVARSFQEAALPKLLPNISGYTFDAIYEAGRSEAQIGGDWYDAFPLLDGRIVVSIGDVAGSGLRAAVTMSNMRQAIRGVAQVHADPDLMLEAADRTLRSEYPDAFVTVFVGVIDPLIGQIVYQSAGHLRPLISNETGVEELEGGGLPLGLRGDDEGSSQMRALPAGSLLVLFTDGLVEASHRFAHDSQRLAAIVASRAIRESEHPAKAIHDAMLRNGSKDDVAILTIHCGAVERPPWWHIASARDAGQTRIVRDRVLSALETRGVTTDGIAIAQIILAELIGNLARYAPGPAKFSLTWSGEVPVLHVADTGPGYHFAAKLPADPLSESGRGLFLISALSRDFVVTKRHGGGSHSRVVLRT
jgi:PAS domain S-box-containing protein